MDIFKGKQYLAHFSIELKGFWPERMKEYTLDETGVYFVFSGKCVGEEKESRKKICRLSKVTYIGKAKDIRDRLSNHNHENDFINACAEGEVPYFACATTLAKDRSHCEEALIWHYKPEINKQGTVSFGHHATRVTITGADPRCLNDLDFVTSKEYP